MSPRPVVLLGACITLLLAPPSARAQVLTAQGNAARTGFVQETQLTPANVNPRTFGKRARVAVDGAVFAQPLVVPQVRMADGRTHDLLVVATERDAVDAWDADAPGARPYWHVSLLAPGETPLARADVRCGFIAPDIGITSTPVVDAATGTLYVLARSKAGGRFVQRLHALDVRTGGERPGSPVEITARVRGRGDGARGGDLAFDPLRENPRAALLLAHGLVWLSWASSCDVGPYHGWILTYDARTLAQRGVLCLTPDAGLGGVWQADTGPALDAEGRVFLVSGNGGFDADKGGRDLGNSVVALAPGAGGAGIRVTDTFTPFDQAQLDAEDGDLGSGGPIVAGGDAVGGPARVIFASKAGKLYVMDPARLGGYHAGRDAVVQSFDENDGEYGAPAYWNGHLYVQGSDAPLRDYALRAGRLATPARAQSSARMPNPGATPTVSANGAQDGIVWTLESKPFGAADKPAVLRAYAADDVARELWTSEQSGARDRCGACLRFNTPTVWNGKVYVGTRDGVDVYGLLAPPKR